MVITKSSSDKVLNKIQVSFFFFTVKFQNSGVQNQDEEGARIILSAPGSSHWQLSLISRYSGGPCVPGGINVPGSRTEAENRL